MKHWDVLGEEASIVLVGNMNPKIFHPEWFIRKGIVEEWDYSKDELISLPDMVQMELPNARRITVLLNQFSIRTSLASEYFSIRDLVIHTFSLLGETPVSQMGMNLTNIIKIPDKDKWMQFGKKLAPQEYWKQAATFFDSLDEEKQKELGLWEMIMHLPRSDDLKGYIRPKIAVLPHAGQNTLEFSINNHIEIENSNAITMIELLEKNWDKSISLAQEITSNILTTQLSE